MGMYFRSHRTARFSIASGIEVLIGCHTLSIFKISIGSNENGITSAVVLLRHSTLDLSDVTVSLQHRHNTLTGSASETLRFVKRSESAGNKSSGRGMEMKKSSIIDAETNLHQT